MKSLAEIGDISGKRVLVRSDFNVPVNGGVVGDMFRLRATVPTIDFLVQRGAKVVLMSHLGRPEGSPDPVFSLDPVADALSKILKKEVLKLQDFSGPEVEGAVTKMFNGDVALLPNVRFSPDEKGNKGDFAATLARLGDVFVQDGFAVVHRADASVVGVAALLPSFAGLLLEKEITELRKVLEKPAHPFVAILGGLKIETKIPVLQNILPIADSVLIGGALINTYLKQKGYEVCDSVVDMELAKVAEKYMEENAAIIARDWVVGSADGARTRVSSVEHADKTVCAPGEAIFDIGPETIEMFKREIARAKYIVWNGAMGKFETEAYAHGTHEIARAVSAAGQNGAHVVIGGGETVQVVEALGLTGSMNHVSTGGGAMLEFLSGKELPGISVLG